jgi:hypothetical protein
LLVDATGRLDASLTDGMLSGTVLLNLQEYGVETTGTVSRKDKTRNMIVTSSNTSLHSAPSAEKNGMVTNAQQPVSGNQDVSGSREQSAPGGAKLVATTVSQTAAAPRFLLHHLFCIKLVRQKEIINCLQMLVCRFV